jgi:hypothetical protein
MDGGEVRGEGAETEANLDGKEDREGEADTEISMEDEGGREGEAEAETRKEGSWDCEGEAENVGETEEGQNEEDDIGEEVQRMIQALPVNDPNVGKEPPNKLDPDKNVAGKALMFQRWLRLLVNHWGALDVISAHGSKSSHDIHIKLVHARHPDTYADQGMTMNPWRDTIRRLATYLETHPQSLDPEKKFDAELCISTLERYLKDKIPYHSLMKAFNWEPENPNKFSGTYHCEAVLAAIIYLGLHPKEGFPDLLGEV